MALEQTLNDTLTPGHPRLKGRPDRRRGADAQDQGSRERRTAKGFGGRGGRRGRARRRRLPPEHLQKALGEHEKAGERGAGQGAQLRFEVAFCEGYLPKRWNKAWVRALCRSHRRARDRRSEQVGASSAT